MGFKTEELPEFRHHAGNNKFLQINSDTVIDVLENTDYYISVSSGIPTFKYEFARDNKSPTHFSVTIISNMGMINPTVKIRSKVPNTSQWHDTTLYIEDRVGASFKMMLANNGNIIYMQQPAIFYRVFNDLLPSYMNVRSLSNRGYYAGRIDPSRIVGLQEGIRKGILQTSPMVKTQQRSHIVGGSTSFTSIYNDGQIEFVRRESDGYIRAYNRARSSEGATKSIKFRHYNNGTAQTTATKSTLSHNGYTNIGTLTTSNNARYIYLLEVYELPSGVLSLADRQRYVICRSNYQTKDLSNNTFNEVCISITPMFVANNARMDSQQAFSAGRGFEN